MHECLVFTRTPRSFLNSFVYFNNFYYLYLVPFYLAFSFFLLYFIPGRLSFVSFCRENGNIILLSPSASKSWNENKRAQQSTATQHSILARESRAYFYFFTLSIVGRIVSACWGLRKRKMASPCLWWQGKHLVKESNNDLRRTPTRWRQRVMLTSALPVERIMLDVGQDQARSHISFFWRTANWTASS